VKIPHKKKEKVNKIQYAIASDLISDQMKKHIFFKLVNNLLTWTREELKKYDLEEHEIDSEIFIMSCSLLDRFDETRSSLIPFLERHIDWELSRLFKKLRREVILKEKIQKDYIIVFADEIYLKSPELFIFEDKFLGKLFTQSEKYVIHEILLEEHINYLNLSEKLSIDRRTLKNKIDIIRTKLEDNYYG